MAGFKFIHAADLHLDSPLRGLERYEGAPVENIRLATRHATENLVTLAIEEQVAFVVIAGDVYDGNWLDFNTGLFFAAQMARLQQAGIAVYLISGNHDAASVITRSLTLPDNVHQFPTDQAATAFHKPTNTALHGQGFARRDVSADLSANYPAAEAGCFNLGILHTSAGGYEEHATYAPCNLQALCHRGYDYWALGHIHLRQTLNEQRPIVAFSGNIQGRHMRETGPKGCLLVTVNDHTPTTEFRPLDVFRWQRCPVNAADCETAEEVLPLVADEIHQAAIEAEGRPVAVRIEVTGATAAHAELLRKSERWTNEIRALALQESEARVWVEKVRFVTQPPAQLAQEMNEGPLQEIRNYLQVLKSDPEQLQSAAGELTELSRKLPVEIRELIAPAGWEDSAWLESLVDEAGSLLLAKLGDPTSGDPDATGDP